MDKHSFLNLAPEYYMLALYIHLQYPREYYTDASWQKEFWARDDYSNEEYCYIENAALRAEAVRLMLKHGAISIIADPFGPTIWQKTATLDEFVEQLERSPTSVFFRAKASGDPKSWLYAALQKVNLSADQFGITELDFHAQEVFGDTEREESVDEWSPIQIEQTNVALQHAITTLDDTIQQVEQSNGYASEHAEERRYVLDGLKALSHTLKTASSVSVRYVKHNGFAMLKLLRDRFTNTAIDQSAKAASDALWHLVKTAAEWTISYFTGSGP
jgi:hypothetical protein